MNEINQSEMDIVERLLNNNARGRNDVLMIEAADEIERLWVENERLQRAMEEIIQAAGLPESPVWCVIPRHLIEQATAALNGGKQGERMMGQHVGHRHSDEIHELKAENERLRDRIDQHHKMFEAMRAEIARLKVQWEAAKREAEIEVKGLRAEVARLKAQITATTPQNRYQA